MKGRENDQLLKTEFNTVFIRNPLNFIESNNLCRTNRKMPNITCSLDDNSFKTSQLLHLCLME